MSPIKQKGLSLVEIMVAIALASVIIAGIIQVFQSNRQSYNLTEGLVRVQENGRFAINYMNRVLRGVSNYGCIPSPDGAVNNVQIHLANTRLTEMTAIQNNAPGTGAQQMRSTADGAAVAGTFDLPDTLTLLVGDGREARVESLVAGSSPAQLNITADAAFAAGDYVLVSSCQVGDFIRLGANTAGTVIEDGTNSLRTDFLTRGDTEITVEGVQAITFFVQDDSLRIETLNTNTGNRTAAQELLSGIENMQIRYGVDRTGDEVADYFDNITAVINEDDIDRVVAIEINLLAISGSAAEGASEAVTSSAQTITLGGQTATFNDVDRLRRAFQSTIALRNERN